MIDTKDSSAGGLQIVGSEKFIRNAHMYGTMPLTYRIAILYANAYIYKYILQ